MSDSTEILQRKIDSAGDLGGVVRTMKTLAASSIGQYEKSVRALDDYYKTLELSLSVCFRDIGPANSTSPLVTTTIPDSSIGVIVFGSDQGLVGQFNEALTTFVSEKLAALPGEPKVWAVGERIHARLSDAGLTPAGLFTVPNSIAGIAPLVGQIQTESEAYRAQGPIKSVYVFHNRPLTAAHYEPVYQRLLPLDDEWQLELIKVKWPTKTLPEVIGGAVATLPALIREYLFISLFRACAESLASENASRLAAMQRAEKNIEELLEELNNRFHHLRQSRIDEELFDVVSGYELRS